MRRQADWTQRGTPHVWAIIGETAIRHQVGGASTMRHQLEHLLDLSDLQERVTLQVSPFSAGAHSAMEMAYFTVLHVEDTELSAVNVEGPTANLFLDSPSDIAHYQRVFEHLRKAALNTPDSQALMARVKKGSE